MLQSKLLHKTFILVQEFLKHMGKYESYGQFNEKIIDRMDDGHFVYLMWLHKIQESPTKSCFYCNVCLVFI